MPPHRGAGQAPQVRHDGHKFSIFLNCGTLWQAEIQCCLRALGLWMPAQRDAGYTAQARHAKQIFGTFFNYDTVLKAGVTNSDKLTNKYLLSVVSGEQVAF